MWCLLWLKRDMEDLPRHALETPAATSMDSHRQPSAASRPRIQPGAGQVQPNVCQQPKTPCSRRRWGLCIIALVEEGGGGGTYQGLFQPSEELPPWPSSGLLRAHPVCPETPPPAEAATSGLWSPGWRGRVGLAGDTWISLAWVRLIHLGLGGAAHP